MRDYFTQPAQTNLELYTQVLSRGSSLSQRRGLAQAYVVALRQVFPLARGSGKPFICHLVGTASLVFESGCPPEWVTAALLHAVYQRRIPFADAREPEDRRALIANLFGAGVDDIIQRYTEFENVEFSAISANTLKSDADVVTLRLADELEDICGYALALHGRASLEEPGLRGSAAWRRETKAAEAEELISIAGLLGLNGLARGLTHWLDFSSCPAALQDFRTGWYSSVDLSL